MTMLLLKLLSVVLALLFAAQDAEASFREKKMMGMTSIDDLLMGMESDGKITTSQRLTILSFVDKVDESVELDHSSMDLLSTFSGQALAAYLESEKDKGNMTEGTAFYLSNVFQLLPPTRKQNHPAPANYDITRSAGVVQFLGKWNRLPFSNVGAIGMSNGIWGYANSGREYALVCKSR